MNDQMRNSFAEKLAGYSQIQLMSPLPFYDAAILSDTREDASILFEMAEIFILKNGLPLVNVRNTITALFDFFRFDTSDRNSRLDMIKSSLAGSLNAAVSNDGKIIYLYGNNGNFTGYGYTPPEQDDENETAKETVPEKKIVREKDDKAVVLFTETVPSGYILSEDNTKIISKKKKQEKELCSNTFGVKQMIQDIDDNSLYLNVQFEVQQNVYDSRIFRAADVYEGKVLKELNNFSYKPLFAPRDAALVGDYLREFVEANVDELKNEQLYLCKRIGWTDDHYQEFVPYSQSVSYDPIMQTRFSKEYLSVLNCSPHGSTEGWINWIRQYRGNQYLALRIMLAATFSSVLVKPLSGLSFILHVWGNSGLGKSVVLKACASIFANPGENAGYIKSFNATLNGLELAAQFYGNMPFFIDELQTNNNSRQDIIYMLTEGIPKVRGMSQGGIRAQNGWCNAIITTGEHSLSTSDDDAGAQNRVIDLYVDEPLISNDKSVINEFCKGFERNYACIGSYFVQRLIEDGMEHATDLYNDFLSDLQDHVTGKQASPAALIMTADALLDEWFFNDGVCIKVEDLLPYMKTRDDINTNKNAHLALQEWITSHQRCFDGKRAKITNSQGRKVYAFLSTYFTTVVRDELGYDPEAYFRWAVQNGYAPRGDEKHLTTRFNFTVDGEQKRMTCYAIYDWDSV